MGDELERGTRRRTTAAVVVLVAGVVVAIAAPIAGGDRFLLNSPWLWVTFTPTRGGPTTTQAVTAVTPVFVQSSGGIIVRGSMRSTIPAGNDFVALVASDSRWIAPTAALVVIPLWFWWWRRSAMSFARGIGVLASAATTAALVALTWSASEFCAAHVLVAAPVAYLTAFLVAPAARERA